MKSPLLRSTLTPPSSGFGASSSSSSSSNSNMGIAAMNRLRNYYRPYLTPPSNPFREGKSKMQVLRESIFLLFILSLASAILYWCMGSGSSVAAVSTTNNQITSVSSSSSSLISKGGMMKGTTTTSRRHFGPSSSKSGNSVARRASNIAAGELFQDQVQRLRGKKSLGRESKQRVPLSTEKDPDALLQKQQQQKSTDSQHSTSMKESVSSKQDVTEQQSSQQQQDSTSSAKTGQSSVDDNQSNVASSNSNSNTAALDGNSSDRDTPPQMGDTRSKVTVDSKSDLKGYLEEK